MTRRIPHILVLLSALFWGLGSTSEAHAQLDSLSGAVQETRPRYKFKNSYNGSIKGNVSSINMTNQVGSTVLLRNGWVVSTNLRVNETTYRLQDRADNSRNLSFNVTMPLATGLAVNGRVSDSRFFNRLVTFSNDIQDFKNDSQTAAATVTYTRMLPRRVAFTGGTSASVRKSEQTFLEDQSRRGSVHGQLGYNFGSRVKLKGRGSFSKSDDSADTGGRTNKGLGVDEDSLVARLDVTLTDDAFFSVDYSQATRSNEFMDLPRGVFQEVQFRDNLNREVETRTLDDLTLNATTHPLDAVELKLTGQHNESVSDFLVAKTRFNRRVTDVLRAEVSYKMGRATNVDARIERREVLNDLGPQSLGSFRDERRGARLTLAHSFTPTFTFNFQTGASISQAFFLDFEINPRDRDQLDQFMNLKINSKPFPKITASIYLALNQTDFVNIDGSLSQNNRAETTYDFRPELTYTLNDRIQIKQTYGLNLELTEFDFDENNNFLDRNFIFSNTVRSRLSKALSTELYYQLLLHDRGSYLRPAPGEERLLNIEQEDRRDQMNVSFRYKINSHLTLLGKNEYSRRRDQFGAGNATVFIDGGLEIGIEGAYRWGTEKNLNVKLRKVNRFGRFNSEEQESYWIMDSSVKYAF
ncbi:MAG: hypothetical protein V3V49_13375 [Candidatus Krumholzibacteria bacterium]